MSFQKSILLFSLLLAGSPASATVLWDGRDPSITDLEDWSWSNQVGDYQYYIHGESNISSYVNLGSDFKNPDDSGSAEGIKITLDSTAYWNGQTMRRTELIPQTTAAINSGKVYYHFSISRSDTNAPSEYREHQIAFFESHFTELKSGWVNSESATSDALLRWNANSETQWNVTWEAGVWHNVAYGIDFSANTVEFYHSTGADDLVLTAEAVSATVSSNGADWHVGVLELQRDGYDDTTEDFFFSGVYIEDELTLSVSGGSTSSSSSSSVVVSAAASSTAVAAISSTPSTSTSVVATTSSVASTSSIASSSTEVASSSSIAAAVTSSITTSAAATTSITPTTLATVVASSAQPSTTYSSASSSASILPVVTEIEDEVGATSVSDKISMWISQVVAAMVISLAGEDAESSS